MVKAEIIMSKFVNEQGTEQGIHCYIQSKIIAKQVV